MLIQMTFFCLLIVALVAGIFSYYPQLQKPIDPLKIAMDKVGYTNMESTNQKKSQQINIAVNKGLMQIHGRMDSVAVEQNKFLDALQDQQQVLDYARNDAQAVLMKAKQEGRDNDRDVLELKQLAAQMADQQRLMVARGRELIALNNRLTQSRNLLANQADLVNMNAPASWDSLQNNFTAFQNQSREVYDKLDEYNQKINDQMRRIQDELYGMGRFSYKSFVEGGALRGRIKDMLDKEHEDMNRLADCRQRSRDLMQEARQKLADEKEKADALQQSERDLMGQEQQKQQDQLSMIQQRMADEKERLAEKQNGQGLSGQSQQGQGDQQSIQQRLADERQRMQDKMDR